MLNKDPLREYVYEDLTEKIPMGAVIVLAAAAILAAGEIVFLILNGAGGRPGYAAAWAKGHARQQTSKNGPAARRWRR